MSIAANTVALYLLQNNLNDSGPNSYNLSQVGTVPFVTTPAPATITPYYAGTFTDTQYFNCPAGLNTAFSSLSNYSIECDVYLNSYASQPVVISTTDGALISSLVVGNLGALLYNTGAGFLVSANGTAPLTTNFNFAVTWDGVNRKIWKDGAVVATDAVAGATLTSNNYRIGTYVTALGIFWTGYVNNVRFSNIARISFPTVDPIETAGSVVTMMMARKNMDRRKKRGMFR
jgi:hypothetical protein